VTADRGVECRFRSGQKAGTTPTSWVYADPAGHPFCLCFLVGDARYPDPA
jgi:hypothetical protein